MRSHEREAIPGGNVSGVRKRATTRAGCRSAARIHPTWHAESTTCGVLSGECERGTQECEMPLSFSPFAGWENDSHDPTPLADTSGVWCVWEVGIGPPSR